MCRLTVMSEPFYNPYFKNEGERQRFIGKMNKKSHLERNLLRAKWTRKMLQLEDNIVNAWDSKLYEATINREAWEFRQPAIGYYWAQPEELYPEPGLPMSYPQPVPGDEDEEGRPLPFIHRLYTAPPHPPRPPSP